MLTLLMLRHADAVAEAASDAERELTAKGEKQARAVGEFCAEHKIIPAAILTSPARRAVQTARLVAHALGLEECLDKTLSAGMQPATGLELLQRHEAHSPLMIVGHEPDFSALAGDLLGLAADRIHFRKASLLRIDLDEVRFGIGRLEYLIPAKFV
jgi:phosphohistidine phosphatase